MPNQKQLAAEQEECGVEGEGRGREGGFGEGRRAREDEGEEKGEALEERSGGRKAEVFVDRGKGKQAAAATSMAAPVSASGAKVVFCEKV